MPVPYGGVEQNELVDPMKLNASVYRTTGYAAHLSPVVIDNRESELLPASR